MATYNLDLLFFPGHYDAQKSPMLPGPNAHVWVKTISSIDRSDESFSVISPECVTLKGLEDEIERLIKELEAIRRKARLRFEKDKKAKEKFFKVQKR